MTDFNEQVDEFAPATEPPAAPAQPANPPAAQVTQPIEPAAAEPAAEPVEQPTAYQSIIDQQSEQIAALIAHNESLTKQINTLIQNGAQIGAPAQPAAVSPTQAFNPPSLQDNNDWSLEALGREMAKGKHM